MNFRRFERLHVCSGLLAATFEGALTTLARREPVLDPNFDPPRVVRHVGWRRCMCCRGEMWTPDVVRVRLCEVCKSPPVVMEPCLTPASINEVQLASLTSRPP
jgi:hypothetical protein